MSDPQTPLIVIQMHTHTAFTNTLLSDNPLPVYKD